MTRLIVIGPPGSGKGTQLVSLSARLGVIAVSTGDIFRDHVRRETSLGLEVKEIIARGGFVPDNLTNHLIQDRLSAEDVAHGFILDGYPRTLAQAEYLDDLLRSKGQALDGVLELSVDTDEVVARLLKRATEQSRVDDTEEIILDRQKIYAQETLPLLDIYNKRQLLVTVDAAGEIDAVASRIDAALADKNIFSS